MERWLRLRLRLDRTNRSRCIVTSSSISAYIFWLAHHWLHTIPSTKENIQWADSQQYHWTASLLFRAWPQILRLLRESKSCPLLFSPFSSPFPFFFMRASCVTYEPRWGVQTENDQSADISLYFPETGFVDRTKFTESDTHTHCGWKGMSNSALT